MRVNSAISAILTLAVLLTAAPDSSLAQSMRTKTVDPAAATASTIFKGEVRGDESANYLVAATAGQILSVDMFTSNNSLYFNILPKGSDEALFIGSTAGNVADISVPATGEYVVQIYLMRNAARRDEHATYSLGVGLGGAEFADSLSGGPDWWQVSGLTAGDALNIRSGPATRYPVVSTARAGGALQNLGCRMTGSARWCNVQVGKTNVQGWAAGRYLTEGAPPAAP